MQVQRQVTADEALGAFMKLARATRMTGDEHDQFMLYTQVLKAELDNGSAAKQELEALKVEHAKCADKPSGANPDSGQVASQGDGSNVGENERPVGTAEQLQESVQ